MKILVIDDSPIHQQAARQTLMGHALTIAKSYEEGFMLLAPIERGGMYVVSGMKGGVYDAVLSDLLMPASGRMMESPSKFEGKEQPLGWALILRAVLNGATRAAIVSDAHHHAHPAAYALETIDNAIDGPTRKPQFTINGAKVGFYYHSPTCLVQGVPGCRWECARGKNQRGETCELCHGTGLATGKDWGTVLEWLLEATPV